MVKQPSIGKLISLISRVNQRKLASQLKAFGIGSGGAHSYLKAILQRPGQSQEQLTSDLKFDKATTTRTVRQLEEAGYIERRTDEKDRRSIRLYPTQKGKEFAPTLQAILDESNSRLTRDLTAAEQRQFVQLLQKVYGSLLDQTEGKE
ncbi:MarR family transcriptional regulator [Paenibacillus physcomitrellae]|uniref:MarR family transcriptional regulator n=1 Tax=Paenibacillus physcomitrellae TaxID=1619311 RepID=A0ABQ1GPJ8_9BACL|nr:MarR family transcriptional regulator [Paenibacillus physcomitrellae]GGA47948.1 MarR family transcriptional regulator [Paenibacillus physcomitrellae]